MEEWKKDARREPVITDLNALVPKDHLLRKIEKVMDYDWQYERLDPYSCHDKPRFNYLRCHNSDRSPPVIPFCCVLRTVTQKREEARETVVVAIRLRL